jgi:uncharacterized damage-inducible protein DinB
MMAQTNMADERAKLLARIAAARSALWGAVVGLDETALTQPVVSDKATVKDLLAHIAAWDELFTERIELVLAGRTADIVSLDMDTRNAQLLATRKVWSLAHVVETCVTARTKFLTTFARVPDDLLDVVPTGLPTGVRQMPLRQWAELRAGHDATHTTELNAWHKQRELKRTTGPRVLLMTALRAAREELLTTLTLVPSDKREQVLKDEGERWTPQGVLGHIAAWDEFFSRDHAAIHQAQTWDEVWHDFHMRRRELVLLSESLSDEQWVREAGSPWNPKETPYQWGLISLFHDHEHATELREELGVKAEG